MPEIPTGRPARPDEVEVNPDIPDFVFTAVNRMLAKTSGSRKVLRQSAVVREIKYAGGVEKVEVWWLDFEPNYREAGWIVTYDRPGYNETYEASYVFAPKARRGSSVT